MDATLCEGGSATLQAVSAAANFRWEPEDRLAAPNQKSTVASPRVTTKYYLYASTELCEVKDSVILTVNKAPIANAGADVSVCYGKEVTLQASGGTSYHWQPTTYLSDVYSGNPVAKCPAGTFLYFLSATDQHGCSSLETDTVAVHVTPPPKLFAGNDTAIIAGVPFQLQAVDVNNSGFIAYYWSPAGGLNFTTTAVPLATIDRQTKYIVTASTPEGCAGTDDIVLKPYAGPAIYVPGAFTPNGDGLNDVAKVITVGIKSLLYFSIYDRWGHRMFTTSQAEQGWNGTLNGIIQSTGAYIWMVAGIDTSQRLIERKGTLVLLR